MTGLKLLVTFNLTFSTFTGKYNTLFVEQTTTESDRNTLHLQANDHDIHINILKFICQFKRTQI